MRRTPFLPLIGSILLLVFMVASYTFWYSLISVKSTEAATITQKIMSETAAASSAAAAQAQLDSLTTEEDTINQYFVSTNDVVPFLEQLTTTGKYFGAGVAVASVSAMPGTPYGKLDVSLTITGSFDAVLRTIGAIEYGPYDTAVSNVSFSYPQNAGVASSSPTWTANASFTIGAQTGTSTPAAAPASSAPPPAPGANNA